MKKALSEMSLEELWQLFPIYLVKHKESWALQYAAMEQSLRRALPTGAGYRISHIGSTSVRGIMAKDIVDILLEVKNGLSVETAAAAAETAGFIRMSEEPERISLNNGYTPDGFADEVFHLHIRRWGDNDELYFRDYLNGHPEEAAAYEELKLGLWKRFEHDRDAYTNAKTDFIRARALIARELYGNRYA